MFLCVCDAEKFAVNKKICIHCNATFHSGVSLSNHLRAYARRKRIALLEGTSRIHTCSLFHSNLQIFIVDNEFVWCTAYDCKQKRSRSRPGPKRKVFSSSPSATEVIYRMTCRYFSLLQYFITTLTHSYHCWSFFFLSPGSVIWPSRVLSQSRKTGSSTCKGTLCTRVSPAWVQVWWRYQRCVKNCVPQLPLNVCFWIHTLLSACLRGSPKPRLHTSYCTPVPHMFINKCISIYCCMHIYMNTE